jgi:hypothetical protein
MKAYAEAGLGRRDDMLSSLRSAAAFNPTYNALYERALNVPKSQDAALDPPPTEDLYFVANTEGGHFFSKTLQEHNRNVARYRQLLEESRNPSTGGLSPAPAPAVQKSRPVRTSP